MKNQALFSSIDKSKKLKCCLLQFLFGAFWVKKVSCRQEQTGSGEREYTELDGLVCLCCFEVV